MTAQPDVQILKTRDDPAPISMQRCPTPEDPGKPFLLLPDQECSWANQEDALGPRDFRDRIEPWLTALLQSEHLSLLVGSGLTHAVHHIAASGSLPAMDPVTWATFGREINTEAKRTSEAANRKAENFEDQIRAANNLLAGLRILAAEASADAPVKQQVNSLQTELDGALQAFIGLALQGENDLARQSTRRREEAFNYLVSFLMTFSSRTGTRERLHLFTTNYDRYIEAGSDVAGLRLIDRFVGVVAPVFRASRLDIDLHYNPPGIRGEPRYLEGVARFTKTTRFY